MKMAVLLKARPLSPSQKQDRSLGAGTMSAAIMIAKSTFCTTIMTWTFDGRWFLYVNHLGTCSFTRSPVVGRFAFSSSPKPQVAVLNSKMSSSPFAARAVFMSLMMIIRALYSPMLAHHRCVGLM